MACDPEEVHCFLMWTKQGRWIFLSYIWEEEAPNCGGGFWWWEEFSLCSVCLLSWNWIGRALWDPLRTMIFPFSRRSAIW